MIITLRSGATLHERGRLIEWLEHQGLTVHLVENGGKCTLGLIGDTHALDENVLHLLDSVESVKHVNEPYKNVNRKFHQHDTIVDIAGVKIGGGHFCVMAGPCSVESEEQIVTVAKQVKEAGANLLRGGAFKPRTSPYDFQGMQADGLKLLQKAKAETGLPIVTEIMSLEHLPLFADVDLIQVGARNMQNFELLKALGKVDKPILLKRGLAATIKEWLMSAEYIIAGGNKNIILCERGIRTFETQTRNTLDLAAIPLLHQLTHLPVIVDPSHATGIATLVHPLSLAAVAAGSDGLMIEVHNDPAKALCDGPQSLKPEDFATTMEKVMHLRKALVG